MRSGTRRSGKPDASSEELEVRALRRFLERVALHRAWGREAVSEIERKPSEYASSYSSYEVRVRGGGRTFRLYLKDYGSPRFAKESAGTRRRRERAVYRNLLVTRELGTAKYYGSHWDPENGRFWLLLEYVNGVPLRAHGFSSWVASVAWLGRFHGMFHRKRESLRICRFLARHDEEFFLRAARRAIAAVRTFGGSFEDGLVEALEGYEQLVHSMTRGPRTLVHGSYLPADILVAETGDAIRVCPVDWELTAYGVPWYDLAFIVDGFDGDELEGLLSVYREAARDEGLVLPREDVLERLNCFRLHKLLLWLGQSRARGYSQESVAQLLEAVLSARSAPETRSVPTEGRLP